MDWRTKGKRFLRRNVAISACQQRARPFQGLQIRCQPLDALSGPLGISKSLTDLSDHGIKVAEGIGFRLCHGVTPSIGGHDT